MRKPILLIPAVVLGLFAVLPPVGAQEAGAAGDAAAGGGNVPGFATVATHAQGQAATGYFFNVGNEENRLVGALSAIATPPASSTNVAALVQRGVVASFVYGMAGGGGPGKAGALPDPPPGRGGRLLPRRAAGGQVPGAGHDRGQRPGGRRPVLCQGHRRTDGSGRFRSVESGSPRPVENQPGRRQLTHRTGGGRHRRRVRVGPVRHHPGTAPDRDHGLSGLRLRTGRTR